LLSLAGLQIGLNAYGSEGPAHLTVAPLVALGMLVSGLLGPVTAIFAVTLTVLGAALAQVADPQLLAGAWLVAGFGAHAVSPLRKLNDLFRATYYTTGVFALVAFSISIFGSANLVDATIAAGWGAVGGVGATALFWLAVAGLGRAFGVVSDWALLELCSPDHPLMRDLVLKAPGTYAHSVMVGNLAEGAASGIGANALLCRAMAYYHDVGTLNRPEFFIENKRTENPHDKLAPSLSARIIGAHVKDGLEIAEEHKLPEPIRDGIAQHHGTSLISYFYSMATRDTAIPDPILEQHFRYSGPRPRTKEAAVLMLADRVEAATRTLSRQTPGRLRTFIWEIVQDVRDDGQLDDSELNFRDLQTIVRSFVHTIGALNHERIEYPGANFESIGQEAQHHHSGPDGETHENDISGEDVGDDAGN
jgi:putative nucleotidyltransferase with HDIG domain